MDLQRKIQQLRNDSDDEFADAVEDMILRATVAAVLAALRAQIADVARWQLLAESISESSLEPGHDGGCQGLSEDEAIEWLAKLVVTHASELDAAIAKLGLTAEAFDAAIASRPDALEKLTDEALEETK